MADNEKTASDDTSSSAAPGPSGTPGVVVTPPPAGDPKDVPQDKAKDLVTSPAKTSGFVTGLVVAAVIVVAGLGAAFIYRAALIDLFVPGISEEAGRMAALEAKLAALEEADRRATAATASLANDLATRRSEIAALSNTLGQLEEGGGETVASDLEAAKSMIAALEGRLDTFEAETGEQDPMVANDANPGQQAQSAGDVTRMKDALATLSERFAAMNESLDQAGGRIEALEEVAPPENLGEILQGLSPRNELGELSARLAAIEEADPEGAAKAAVLALSATELARAAATSGSFATELGAFAALAPGDPFAAQLQPFAQRGAPTAKALLLEFETAIDAITEAERIREGGGVWNWIVNQFTALFSIRKVGELDGDDWQSILARAENRIAIEDLAAAVEELARLEGPAAQGAAPWLERARARRQVDTLVTGLTAQVFADLLTALESE